METTRSDLRNEVEAWLKTILKNENIKDLSANILGNSEKGDGYLGDIVFVTARGTTESGSQKIFDIVLKCSKNSEILRATSPVREAFLVEIFVYDVLLPYFIQFQVEKGIEYPFNSVAKCYGTLTEENKEVIALENLKSKSYELCPKKDPLPRKHIDLVVTEYGKFHATSVALQHQQPNEFQKFVNSLGNVFKLFKKNVLDLEALYGTPLDESYELLKDDLDQDTLLKWKGLKKQINYVYGALTEDKSVLKAILHGDCWNNNFMFAHDDSDGKTPLKVKFLDWQLSRYDSPILDLSHFLFSCVSSEDFNRLDDILNAYYRSFIQQLEQLGVESPEALYPRNQFLEDWKKFSKYGVLQATFLMKFVSTDKDEVIDLAEMAESGQNFGDAFSNEIKNKDNFRRRMRPIVEYVVKHNII